MSVDICDISYLIAFPLKPANEIVIPPALEIGYPVLAGWTLHKNSPAPIPNAAAGLVLAA